MKKRLILLSTLSDSFSAFENDDLYYPGYEPLAQASKLLKNKVITGLNLFSISFLIAQVRLVTVFSKPINAGEIS